jgi:hypothetical protein
MAAVNVKGTNATLTDNVANATQLFPYFNRGRVRSAYDTYTANAVEAASTIKLCYAIPKGAWIMGGKIVHQALGASVTLSVGVIGVSGTAYDNDPDAFLAAGYDASAAGQANLPDSAGVAPYQVTDPRGAFVIITTAGATTTASDLVIKAFIDVVQD